MPEEWRDTYQIKNVVDEKKRISGFVAGPNNNVLQPWMDVLKNTKNATGPVDTLFDDMELTRYLQQVREGSLFVDRNKKVDVVYQKKLLDDRNANREHEAQRKERNKANGQKDVVKKDPDAPDFGIWEELPGIEGAALYAGGLNFAAAAAAAANNEMWQQKDKCSKNTRYFSF